MINSMDVRIIFSLVATFVAFVTSQPEEQAQVIRALGEGIQKELLTIKQPIDETITAVGSSQCANVKKLLGVSYEQIEGEKEPDLTKLTLTYRTRSYTTVYNLTSAADAVPQARGFSYTEKLVIYVHGFLDDPSGEGFQTVSDAFLNSDKEDESTLLALDGSSLIRFLYLRSTTYVQFLGSELAKVLVALVAGGLEPSLIHMVGHSLGSHVCGFTGKTFYNLTGKKIGRITGLDPAGPCFSFVEPSMRLNDTDADHVDVVHSDGGVYGITTAIGHVDYYPNRGMAQPGCFFQTCSHSRAWELFAESVLLPGNFPALRCSDWEAFEKGNCDDEISYMGYPSKPGTRGTFYLQTNGKSPFGKGLGGIKYENDDGLLKTLQKSITRPNRLLAGGPFG